VLSVLCREAVPHTFLRAIAKRLCALQRPCGGYRSFSGTNVYLFDTAQIGMGLLDWFRLSGDPDARTAVVRAAEFIVGMITPSGMPFPIFDEATRERVCLGTSWGNGFSPINCKA